MDATSTDVRPAVPALPYRTPSMRLTAAIKMDVVDDNMNYSTDFTLDDVPPGHAVMSGRTTAGNVTTGVVTRIIRGCGFAFSNPVQDGIFWTDLKLHRDWCCPCYICKSFAPAEMERLEAAAAWNADSGDAYPAAGVRRTDSGSQYGFYGYPDCAFWERQGVEPLFVASARHYGPGGDPTVLDVSLRETLIRMEPTERDGPFRRAWIRQMRPLLAVSPTGRAAFQEPPVRLSPVSHGSTSTVPAASAYESKTPDRPTRPVTPDAPVRPQPVRRNVGDQLPFPPMPTGTLERQTAITDTDADTDTESDVRVRFRFRHIGITDILDLSVPVKLRHLVMAFLVFMVILWSTVAQGRNG